QPAIDLAAKGFNLPFWQAESFNSNRDEFFKNDAAKLIFTKETGEFKIGDLFIQTDLAKTLKLIQQNGREGFYSGRVAELMVLQSQKNGGYFTKEDFENYESVFREPVRGNYRGFEIVSMPPPSSGGICLVQSLNILENFNFSKEEWGSSDYIHHLIEALKYVYADRSKHIGDPDYYNVPTDYLISKEYANEISQKIGEHAVRSSEISPSQILIDESEETTHYSVVDRWGNAVSATVTLNSSYGNKIVVDGAGFLMNNEMDDFSAKPGTPNQFGLIGSEANSIAPGKRMLSSITPVIIKKNDEIFLILGSPGGSKIITSVLQVVLNVIDFKMNLQTAVNLPRIHHQWLPDSLYSEEFGLPEDVKTELIQKGHFIGSETVLGRIQAIMYNNKKNIYVGASDPRGFGKAIGY
ncbi:MAG: gamma-glutamyltransferase, partial [Melioribacteraceae bacterium]|nr:gamma-glutamyltransferase [Melioribacteraceae bacterium]